MRVDYLFYVSLAISCGSFALFALQVIMQLFRRGTAATGIGDARTQSADPLEAMKELREMAHAFAKAGPIATSAALCVIFGLIAMVASGLVKINA